MFSGILVLSLMTIPMTFYAAYEYESKNAERQMRDVFERTKAADDARMVLLSKQSELLYRVRNDVEDVMRPLGGSPTGTQLRKIYDDLSSEILSTNEALKNIQESGQAIAQPTIAFNDFSLVTNAYGQEVATIVERPKSPTALYLAATLITIVLTMSCCLLLFSKDADKIRFAQTTIQSIIGFAIGVITGPAMTRS